MKKCIKDGQEYYWDEKSDCWRMTINDGRMCTIDNETIEVALDNCKEFLERRNRIYLGDVRTLLEKALEGVKDCKDLSDGDREDVRAIRKMIKGL